MERLNQNRLKRSYLLKSISNYCAFHDFLIVVSKLKKTGLPQDSNLMTPVHEANVPDEPDDWCSVFSAKQFMKNSSFLAKFKIFNLAFTQIFTYEFRADQKSPRNLGFQLRCYAHIDTTYLRVYFIRWYSNKFQMKISENPKIFFN